MSAGRSLLDGSHALWFAGTRHRIGQPGVMMEKNATIGSAVIDRLHQLGVRHIFGIPGDYVLSLYQLIERSPIRHIGTTREDCAGFAADAYARINGIGAACVTYCVGGLNCVNAIACAYAERSPVVLLTGSPGLSERIRMPYMHHMVRDFSTQREVFERMTVPQSLWMIPPRPSVRWTGHLPPSYATAVRST
jgi:TPP-dependent 2-oxoacid decarboxylase